MATFMLAMTLFPNKQAIAQDELDRVVGCSRLPTMEDRASLPYVDALIKETLRWHVLLPTSVARRTEKDDVYKGTHRRPFYMIIPGSYLFAGYFIPAGTTMLPNVWYVLRLCSTRMQFSQWIFIGP